jgi:predicted ATPase
LAEALAERGSTERGLALLAEALEVVERTGERFYEAELYRQKGELLFRSYSDGSELIDFTAQSSRSHEIESCFLKAISVAEHQQAKWFELRAATNLARLWHRQGRKEKAHTMLTKSYNWFTEGFDTADLKDAKALLDQLGA